MATKQGEVIIDIEEFPDLSMDAKPFDSLTNPMKNLRMKSPAINLGRIGKSLFDSKFKSTRLTNTNSTITQANMVWKQLGKVKSCMNNGETGNGAMLTPEQQQQALAVRKAQLLELANNAMKRTIEKRNAMKTKLEHSAGYFTIVDLYTNSGAIVISDEGIDSKEFTQIRTDVINPHLENFYGFDEKDGIQDFHIVAGFPIFLLPTAQHRVEIMSINDYPDAARTTTRGNSFRIIPFTDEFMSSIITMGSDRSALPEFEQVTRANLTALCPVINIGEWSTMRFGKWTHEGTHFATFKCDNSAQTAAIKALNMTLTRGNRHERGNESITLMTAMEKFENLIAKPFDSAVPGFVSDTNMRYSEIRTGIIKRSNLLLYPNEQSRRNVFFKIPRRRLDTTPYNDSN